MITEIAEDVNGYMEEAINKIDACFGKGYARANPVLLGAFIQSIATEYQSWMINKLHGDN